MKIIIDAMGGDNAPQAIVQGALDAHKLHGVDIILVGRMEEVLRAVEATLRRAIHRRRQAETVGKEAEA